MRGEDALPISISCTHTHTVLYTHAQRSRIKTLERSGLSVAVYGGAILVDETSITEWDLEASNGENTAAHAHCLLLLHHLQGGLRANEFTRTTLHTGVIHVLDGLLQPAIPGFDPFAQAQDQNEGPPAGVTAPFGTYGNRDGSVGALLL